MGELVVPTYPPKPHLTFSIVFLREYFYDNYKEEWILRSKDITLQPKEAGKYVRNVTVVSPLEVKVFTESLNLEQPLVIQDDTTFSADELEDDDFVYDYDDNYIYLYTNAHVVSVSKGYNQSYYEIVFYDGNRYYGNLAYDYIHNNPNTSCITLKVKIDIAQENTSGN